MLLDDHLSIQWLNVEAFAKRTQGSVKDPTKIYQQKLAICIMNQTLCFLLEMFLYSCKSFIFQHFTRISKFILSGFIFIFILKRQRNLTVIRYCHSENYYFNEKLLLSRRKNQFSAMLLNVVELKRNIKVNIFLF